MELIHGGRRVATNDPDRTAPTLDHWVAALSFWLAGGMLLDAWAHHRAHHGTLLMETFFNPWHAVLYSGYMALAGFLVVTAWKNVARGAQWRRSLPTPYLLSLLGAGTFALAGLADMIGHTLLGVEFGLEAVISPTHILLALSAALIISGPFRAALTRPAGESPREWSSRLAVVISLGLTSSIFSSFSEYGNHLWSVLSDGQPFALHQALLYAGVLSILAQTGILTATVCLAVRIGNLWSGAFVLLYSINGATAVFLDNSYRFVPLVLLGGLAADLLRVWLRPSALHPRGLRWFAFAAAGIYTTLYLLIVMRTDGVGLSAYVATGAICTAGLTGLSLSYVVAPPEVLRARSPQHGF